MIFQVVIQHTNGRETVESTWDTYEEAEDAWGRCRQRLQRSATHHLNVYINEREQEQKP